MSQSFLRKPPLLIVLGATGAGKSKLALELAHFFGGEIISADAMQMYKGLDIVTNKVTKEEQNLVKHHVIDFLDPLSNCTVVDFRNKALPIVEDLLSKNIMPVICGGTNYYIESLLWNILVDQEYSKSGEEGKSSENRIEEGVSSEDQEDHVKKLRTEFNFNDNLVSNEELYEELKRVDPVRASELPKTDRRKVIRSLQVFAKTGKPHSEHLAEQRKASGSSHLGGPLRYPHSLVLWVQCDQAVLDERCNKRVDKMIERGMLKELEDFHKEYNSKRTEPADYTLGIFQSIGFKEFHDFLILSEEEKDSDKGKMLFQKGVEDLKLVTRQYSRRQLKWIRHRFLNASRDSPPVYAVDSSRPALWDTNCLEPAKKIVEAVLNGENPDTAKPLPREQRWTVGSTHYESRKKIFRCDSCERDFQGMEQYQGHIQSKKHQQRLKKLDLMKKPDFRKNIQVFEIDECKKDKACKTLKTLTGKPLSEVLALIKEKESFTVVLDDSAKAKLKDAGIQYTLLNS